MHDLNIQYGQSAPEWRRMRGLFGRLELAIVACGLFLAGLHVPVVLAAPGDLDPDLGGFGIDGRFYSLGMTVHAVAIDGQGRLILAGAQNGTFYLQRRSGLRFQTVETATTIIDGNQLSAVARAVAVAPDGKIVLAGSVLQENNETDFAIARFNDDLTLDETFAGDGTQNSDFDDLNDDAYAVAVQGDLKVVVAGTAIIDGVIYTDNDFAVSRFNENGTLDSGFADNGKWLESGFNSNDILRAIALQADGKIVVAGQYFAAGSDRDSDFTVFRLNMNGSIDDDFGDSGEVDVGFGDEELAYSLAIDPTNGAITVAGGRFEESGGTGPPIEMILARLLADGSPDATFSGDGRLEAPINGTATAFGVVVQPDQKTVVAGRAFFVDKPDQFVLMRFDPDGTLDTSFGDGGRVFTAFGTAAAGAVALAMQANGSFVAAGGGHAARFRTDGSLDAGGVVDLEFDPSQSGSEASALGVDGDGKLVASGKVFLADYDMALARYLPDYSDGLDRAFGTAVPQNGLALAGIAGTIETRAMAIRTDGKIVVAGHSFFNDFNFAIGRFKSDGTPDEACLGVGLATVNFGVGDDSAAAVVVAGDRTYAAGTVAVVGGTDFGLVRLNDACAIDDAGGPVPNDYKFTFDLGGNDEMSDMIQQGSKFVMAGTSAGNIVLIRTRQSLVTGNVFLDTAFGDAGQAVLDLGPGEVVSALGQQSDGKLVVVGTVPLGGGTNFFVARFTADGLIDEDFGLGGVAYASFNSIDNAEALAIRDDDTIVVAGCTTTADGQVFAVAQFTPNGSFDTEFHDDGRVTVRTGPSGEECAEAATFVGPDRLVVGGYSSFFGTRNFVLAAFQEITPITTTTTLSTTTTTLGSTECGDVNGDMAITATDALGVLVAAVGLSTCEVCVCDTDGSGIIAASDSLRVLAAAVGQSVTLACPACG